VGNMRYCTSGTPESRWKAFQEEAQVRSTPSNKIEESVIKDIKLKLRTINPETGFYYGVREVAALTGVGRNTISKIDYKMRRNNNF
jgi:hypothetical protein